MKYNNRKISINEKNLSSFKIAISNSLFLPLLLSIIISSILFFGFYIRDKMKQEEFAKEELLSTNKIFQSELSERLSMFASSDIFFDFITSGEVTRKEILPHFLDQLTTLQTNTISGFKIWYDAFGVKKDIYKYGKYSKTYVTLKLCYSGTYLDNKYGSCYYHMQIYLSKIAVINSLMKINQHIKTCEHCQPTNLLNSFKLGTFIVSGKSNFFVKLRVDTKHDYIFYYYLIIMIMLLFLAMFNRNRIHHLINRVITKPLENLVIDIKNNISPQPSKHALFEINYLIAQIVDWKRQIENIREIEKEAVIGQLVTQVIHDIRSPLSALEMAIQSTTQLPEDIRVLIRKAVWRIHDIANGLLQVNKQIEATFKNSQDNMITAQLLSTSINMIIIEKRLEFRSKSSIEIVSQFDASSYGLFAKVQVSEFNRLLSNLINNAVESLDKKGKVIISLTSVKENITINIIDNGKGIPNEILKKLGKRGLTYDKKNGSGLGLYHAKTCLEKWNGKLNISSEINIGTNVRLLLPKAETPSWFLSNITLINEQFLVVIDDDDSIHQIWKTRIREFEENTFSKIQLKNFYSPTDLKQWLINKNNHLPVTYLCDYEFIGNLETGLDLIINQNIIEYSILVTSRFEDQSIINKCIQEKISIIPKEFSSIVPLLLK